MSSKRTWVGILTLGFRSAPGLTRPLMSLASSMHLTLICGDDSTYYKKRSTIGPNQLILLARKPSAGRIALPSRLAGGGGDKLSLWPPSLLLAPLWRFRSERPIPELIPEFPAGQYTLSFVEEPRKKQNPLTQNCDFEYNLALPFTKV